MNKTFQVEVPEADFPGFDYIAPHLISQWLYNAGLDYSYSGSNSSGTGFDQAGRSNRHIVYMIRKASVGDDVLFKVHFPNCKVYPIRD